MDTSIQNRDDVIVGEDGDDRQAMLGPSRSMTPAERILAAKKRKKRDMSMPFMILVLMDFMIVLLLWIVYEAVSGVH